MIRLRHKVLIRAMRLFDLVVLIASAYVIFRYRPDMVIAGITPSPAGSYVLRDVIGMALLAIGWIGIFDYYIRYRADRLVTLGTQIVSLLKATTFSAFLLLLVSAVFGVDSFNAANIAMFWLMVTVICLLSRLAARMLLTSARRSGYNFRYLLVLGTNDRAADLATKVAKNAELGYKVVGFVAEDEASREKWEAASPMRPKVVGMLDDLRAILEVEKVDEMMVCLSVESKFSTIAGIVQTARELGIVLRVVPDQSEALLLKKLHVEEFDNVYVVTLFREQMLLQLLAKRVVDVTVSAAVLLVLCPLMAVVALLIKLTSPGPVVFAQDRVGMNQRRFRLYKFRSMVADAEARKKELAHLNELDGPAFKIVNDPRVTWIGKLIRKTSVDELPQLFNVLRGEMSLVGPRPPLPDEVSKYEWLFRRRLSVKPGITCLWQVNGRNNTTFEEWMEMDRQYVENWSLWYDFKILLMTIPAVLFGRGAS